MKRRIILSVLAASLASAPAFADTGNLLVCVDLGFALQSCQLHDVKLADHIVEAGRGYEAQFLVRYDFPCSGHAVRLGVQSGDAVRAFTMGATNAVVTLNGSGDLHSWDDDPDVTSALTFRPGCAVSVSSVTVLPSTATVQAWTDEAISEARILNLSVDRYLLAKDYQSLSTWNVDKLNLLKTKLESLVAATPTNLNYKVMLNSVNSALQNQPLSATLDELRRAGEDLIATLRAELTGEIAVAQALVDRFARWQQVANKALADALDHAATA